MVENSDTITALLIAHLMRAHSVDDDPAVECIICDTYNILIKDMRAKENG